MKKYSVLISGKQKIIIDDFFNHLSDDFNLLTTSLRYEDLVNHINLFHPDIFIICLNGETRDEYNVLIELKRILTREGIFVFICGDHNDCRDFNETVVYMAEETFEKPISIDRIKEGILDYMHEKEKKAEEDAQLQLKLEQLKEQQRRKHILIIDDDPVMLKVVKEQLSDDYDVATAISSKIAYKFLDNKDTDMILLDYEMPGEDGPSTFKTLRTIPKLENTPIVFLTGVTDKEKIKEALVLKPQGYLLKPLDREKLLGTIEKFVG